MRVVRTRDRDALAACLQRRAAAHVYELGDLDDFFWPATTWFALGGGDGLRQVALLYDATDPPTLLALPDPPLAEMRTLLAELAPVLPSAVYAHVHPDTLAALASRFAVTAHGLHVKMALTQHALLTTVDGTDVMALGPEHLAEVEAFYAVAYPGTWFQARMLETRRYVGIRESGRLVTVAGVHVWSPRFSAAALGNVATLPAARGRGLATRAAGALCRTLLADGIATIGLNVRADNAPAIRSYEKLGFAPVAEYVEATLRERAT